jgi:hypothetical protein
MSDDAKRLAARAEFIAAFQQAHAVLSENGLLTQQKLLELLTVRHALMAANETATPAAETLDNLHEEVVHCFRRFWAKDVNEEDEFIMSLMVSVRPNAKRT